MAFPDDAPPDEAAAPPPDFACRRCGACCRWEGEVRLLAGEAEAMAAHLGMPAEAFIAGMTQVTRDRRGLTLVERADGACILYRDEPPGCLAYPARPRQCREFPHGWRFPGWQDDCGAGKDSHETSRASGLGARDKNTGTKRTSS